VQPKEKFSILLVDDDPTAIRVLSRILGDYTPLRFATCGQVALKLAREAVPDLVMLDVEMPEFTGFEICKAFKGDPVLAQVPIIFVTSHDSQQLETVGLELGGSDFISKPPHAPLVLARVRTYQQLKALSDTVRSAVTMDFLTGTLTRRQMEKSLAQEWLRAQRSLAPLSLVLADIDGFTAINERFGEESGDACLRTIADALRSVAQRPCDLIARHAGGRFALLLPETNREGAMIVAARALRAVDDLPPLFAASDLRLTLSVGAVTNTAATGTSHDPSACGVPGDLIAAAEQAIRRARSGGGHRAEFVDVAACGLPKPAHELRI
jgi:diguanylate cyclase (GGDEF)-like protein